LRRALDIRLRPWAFRPGIGFSIESAKARYAGRSKWLRSLEIVIPFPCRWRDGLWENAKTSSWIEGRPDWMRVRFRSRLVALDTKGSNGAHGGSRERIVPVREGNHQHEIAPKEANRQERTSWHLESQRHVAAIFVAAW
jgi:hypothetical protein